MRKALFSLLFCMLLAMPAARARENSLFGPLQRGERAALLMVHFGTSHDDTRERTIDAVNARAREAFPDLEVREAWTSPTIIRILKKRGIVRQTPAEVLQQLRKEGYTHIVIQATLLLEGAETESLRHVVARQKGFKEVRIGKPLLYSVKDCRQVTEILAARHADAVGRRNHVVFVGHGSYTPATATYSQLDHLFTADGHPNCHVATIEGYPTLRTLKERLKSLKARRVRLVPLLFVAGDHARNDIAGEWKEALEKEGLQVDCRLEGLGEIPEIQDLYISHIRSAEPWHLTD